VPRLARARSIHIDKLSRIRLYPIFTRLDAIRKHALARWSRSRRGVLKGAAGKEIDKAHAGRAARTNTNADIRYMSLEDSGRGTW
jgi:hypothetical protein